MARILLGVSGGIAAYKALELVRLATAAGHSLRVVQTPTSRRFVGEASFAALSAAPVLVSEFQRDPMRGCFPGQQLPDHDPPSHLQLVANADVYLIAPASANTIAKLAAGLADNLLCSAALAARCPLVLAPAMNNDMYEHPAVRANLQTLAERGATVLQPGSGRLAAPGEQGIGRLPEPPELLAACEAAIAARGGGGEPGAGAAPASGTAPAAGEASPGAGANGSAAAGAGAAAGAWRGLRVLVTAGGTREPIDSVRFIGNSSSGRMGLELARAAQARGAQVTLVAANVALAHPPGVTWREVRTAAELKQACEREFAGCDVLLMAAAVADYRPTQAQAGKIKKAGRERLALTLEATEDVLAGLAARRAEGQTLVGFAAEHGERAVECGLQKLAGKNLDVVVVNDISRADIGFDVDANEVTILTAAARHRAGAGGAAEGTAQARAAATANGGAGVLHVPRATKAQVAEAILDAVESVRAAH